MYLEHFGLSEAPFKITPHTEFFFSGARRGETLEALIYAILAGEGIVKVTGEVGSGKTMLCRVLMERLPDSVEMIYLAVPTLSRDEMLVAISEELEVTEMQGASTTKLIRSLQQKLIEIHADGKHVVALIDEAHAMPLNTLEELRLLSNLETNHDKLLQIVMFGQQELNQHLQLPSMRQLKERITHSFHLQPLPAEEIRDYLDFRLRAAGYKGPDLFSADVLKILADASEGLTRRINIYADKALLAAFAGNTHTITADHIRTAIADTRIGDTPASTKRARRWWPIGATVLSGIAGIAVGVAAAVHWSQDDASKANGGADFQPIAPSSAIGAAPGTVTTMRVPALSKAAAPKPVTPPPTAADTAAPNEAVPDVAKPNAPASSVVAEQASPIATTGIATIATGAATTTKPIATIRAEDINIAARMAADSEKINSLPLERYTVQIMIAGQKDERTVRYFIADLSGALPAGEIMIYPRGTQEKPQLGVIYGDFQDAAAANAAINALPARLKRYQPYGRSFNAISQDLRPVAQAN